VSAKTFVPSESDPEKLYLVECDATGTWTCDCPSRKQPCKHILRYQAEIVAKRVDGPVENLDDGWSALIGRGLVKTGDQIAQHENAQPGEDGEPDSSGPAEASSDSLNYEPIEDLNEMDFHEELTFEQVAALDGIKASLPPAKPVGNIHLAVLAVYEEVEYVKKTYADQLGYSFAGEAAIINVLRPAMVRHGITAHVSKVKKPKRVEYQSRSNARMVNTLLKVQLTLTHAASGTKRKVWAWGEGSDSGDKGVPKAHTGAFKYALRQAFMLETGDDPDRTSSREYEGSGQRDQRPPEQRRAQRETLRQGGQKNATPAWWQFFINERQKAGLSGDDIRAILHNPCTPQYVNAYLEEQQAQTTEEITLSLSQLLKRAVALKTQENK
jgi:hypothetical protein